MILEIATLLGLAILAAIYVICRGRGGADRETGRPARHDREEE
jgi:hypothetical protein